MFNVKKFGLFIGIDKYRKFDSKDHLHCAGSDAIALAQAFQDRLGFTTKVLLDTDLGYAEQGSPETIFDQLDDWASQLKQSDETILVLYFAGHGVMLAGEQYLLAPKAPQHAMTRPSSGLPGVISESALLDHTQHWPNVKRVLVFDACRTALDVRVETTVSARIAYGARKQEPDLAILRACPPDQVALELHHYPVDGQTRSHGLYTAAFLSVLEQRASNERHFILDDGFNRDIANTMQALVQQHAPEGEQIRMQAQQPLRDGAPLCLADVADFNAIKIARLLRTFEDHFAAERYDTPVAQCCADTLRDLVVAKYPPQQVLILSDRLEAARRQQQHQARQVRGESLLRSARMLGTPEAYLRVLEEGFGEYQTEVNEFVAAWQQEKDDAAWREVQADANLVALQKYSRLFPSGRHVAQAQAAIAKLEAAEQEQRENQAWAAVDRASIAALQAFIQHWPNSAHASLVAEMVATLEEDEAWR
ncbi:MAG: Caspase domain, partial [Pseudomonadota bacterium]